MHKIKTRISFHEYLKLLFGLTYQRRMMILLLVIDVLVITWIVLSWFGIKIIMPITVFQYITVTIITIVQPLVVYFTIRRNYYSSAYLMEPIEMEFTHELIKLRGKSFYTELIWVKTYKVVEIKNWFMIYENNLSAILIPKKVFTKAETVEFKTFLKSIKGIHRKLIDDRGNSFTLLVS